MANQLSELDLQRLEDKATQWPGTEFSRDVLDLIQRLRQVEAQLPDLYRAELARTKYVQRLEWVRKAAQMAMRKGWPDEGLGILEDALAAVENKANV